MNTEFINKINEYLKQGKNILIIGNISYEIKKYIEDNYQIIILDRDTYTINNTIVKFLRHPYSVTMTSTPYFLVIIDTQVNLIKEHNPFAEVIIL